MIKCLDVQVVTTCIYFQERDKTRKKERENQSGENSLTMSYGFDFFFLIQSIS
jgi:hypothetical protein